MRVEATRPSLPTSCTVKFCSASVGGVGLVGICATRSWSAPKLLRSRSSKRLSLIRSVVLKGRALERRPSLSAQSILNARRPPPVPKWVVRETALVLQPLPEQTLAVNGADCAGQAPPLQVIVTAPPRVLVN